MIVATTDSIEGKKLKTLGIVIGSTVRARWFGKDIAAAFRNIIGGEIPGYTELLNSAREEAIKRMTDKAEKMGADAVVGVRISTSLVMAGAAEIIAYGTAVKFKR